MFSLRWKEWIFCLQRTLAGNCASLILSVFSFCPPPLKVRLVVLGRKKREKAADLEMPGGGASGAYMRVTSQRTKLMLTVMSRQEQGEVHAHAHTHAHAQTYARDSGQSHKRARAVNRTMKHQLLKSEVCLKFGTNFLETFWMPIIKGCFTHFAHFKSILI